MLTGLPRIVQNWIIHSNMVEKKMIGRLHLKQTGEMKTTSAGNWMPVEAEQYFSVENPGFLWIADIRVAPWIHLAGKDKYQDGKGHMFIQLFSLIPLADAKGKEIDQGNLLRYLAETVWFPSAALSGYIRWQGITATSARATMTYGGITASGVFEFNPAGDVRSFEAQRYYDRKEGATLETWLITVDPDSYREFEGIRIPRKSTVTWKLKTGDFTWLRLEITDVKYNFLLSPV